VIFSLNLLYGKLLNTHKLVEDYVLARILNNWGQ